MHKTCKYIYHIFEVQKMRVVTFAALNLEKSSVALQIDVHVEKHV